MGVDDTDVRAKFPGAQLAFQATVRQYHAVNLSVAFQFTFNGSAFEVVSSSIFQRLTSTSPFFFSRAAFRP